MIRATLFTLTVIAAACGLTAVFILPGDHERSIADYRWAARDWQRVRVDTADPVIGGDSESVKTGSVSGDEDLPAWAFEADEADRSGARFVIAAISTSEDPEGDLTQTAVVKLQTYATSVLGLAPETASRIDDSWAAELLRPGRRVTRPSADSPEQSRILQELIVPPEAVHELRAWQTDRLRGSHNRIVALALLLTGATSGLLFAIARRIHRRAERHDRRG